MKNKICKVALVAIAAMLLPLFSHAEGVADSIHSLQGVLDTLYDQMIPLCSRMIALGSGIAGFATLWYIASRVWKHIAAAEPIDFYPLLRPFVIGFCIVKFTAVLALINGVLKPTVTATHDMVHDGNHAIEVMTDPGKMAQTDVAGVNGDPEKWYQYAHPNGSDGSGANTNPIADAFSGFGIRNWIRNLIYEILNVCFEAAALCIDTIRIFKLIVLAILGPLCFGLSIFDGFQHTLKQWLARYINVYMWLPVANIFGAIIAKIQANMMSLDQAGANSDAHFNASTNTGYLIFMLIGIVGYFTVPSIANYIINVGGHALFSKTAGLASTAVSMTTGMMAQSLLNKQLGQDKLSPPSGGGSGQPSSGGSGSSGNSNNSGFARNKLSGGS